MNSRGYGAVPGKNRIAEGKPGRLAGLFFEKIDKKSAKNRFYCAVRVSVEAEAERQGVTVGKIVAEIVSKWAAKHRNTGVKMPDFSTRK